MIALNGQIYRAVLDVDGRNVVIVRHGKQWRKASLEEIIKVLDGLYEPVFRVVS